MYVLANQPARRTIVLKLFGAASREDMEEMARAYREATASYEGTPHFVLLDTTELLPLAADAEAVLARALDWACLRGVMLCARLSGGVKGAGADDVTVECGSLREAHQLLTQARERLHVPVVVAA